MPPPGILIRRIDLFAAHALSGMLQDRNMYERICKYAEEQGWSHEKGIAEWAYMIADAMQTKSDTI